MNWITARLILCKSIVSAVLVEDSLMVYLVQVPCKLSWVFSDFPPALCCLGGLFLYAARKRSG
jgi:hypothetical protein